MQKLKRNTINDLAQYTCYMTYVIVNTKQLGMSSDYKIRIPIIPVHTNYVLQLQYKCMMFAPIRPIWQRENL